MIAVTLHLNDDNDPLHFHQSFPSDAKLDEAIKETVSEACASMSLTSDDIRSVETRTIKGTQFVEQ